MTIKNDGGNESSTTSNVNSDFDKDKIMNLIKVRKANIFSYKVTQYAHDVIPALWTLNERCTRTGDLLSDCPHLFILSILQFFKSGSRHVRSCC